MTGVCMPYTNYYSLRKAESCELIFCVSSVKEEEIST